MYSAQRGSFRRSALAAVAIEPGRNPSRRIPCLPKSIASDLVKLMTAPLAAAYAGF